jgi:hypothetical protein
MLASDDAGSVHGTYDWIWEETQGKAFEVTRNRRTATLILFHYLPEGIFTTLGPHPMPLPRSFAVDVQLMNWKEQEIARLNTGPITYGENN